MEFEQYAKDFDGVLADVENNDYALLSFATNVSQELKVPLFYRHLKKTHGLRNKIEGDLEKLKACKHLMVIMTMKGADLIVGCGDEDLPDNYRIKHIRWGKEKLDDGNE